MSKAPTLSWIVALVALGMPVVAAAQDKPQAETGPAPDKPAATQQLPVQAALPITIRLDLTPADVSLVGAALRELPYREVADLLARIQSQIDEQQP